MMNKEMETEHYDFISPYYGAAYFMEDKSMDQATHGKVAIFLHIFYEDLVEEIASYVNRLEFCCDIYLTAKTMAIRKKFESSLRLPHSIIHVEYPNVGMDIGPFFAQIKEMKRLKREYSYHLKLHSKKDAQWRRAMLESVLPRTNYTKIFSMIDQYSILGSDRYLYNFSQCHANKDIMLKQIRKHGLRISEDDLYGRIKEFDPANEPFDANFYFEFHYDLNSAYKHLAEDPDALRVAMQRHWKKYGCREKGRLPNPGLIAKNADCDYKFYAGTIFWFNDEYLQYFLKHSDSIEDIEIFLSSEPGRLTNEQDTYAHHLEYWFGLIGSYLQQGKSLAGVKTINILLPEVGALPSSGGFRTIFRFINYLMRQNYIVNIEICPSNIAGKKQGYAWIRFILQSSKHFLKSLSSSSRSTKESLKNIDNFKEIDNVYDLSVGYSSKDVYSDAHIATGWQTFDKAIYYRNRGSVVCFFCQDLEYYFSVFQHGIGPFFGMLEKVKDFYKIKVPTFTMGQYLKNKLNDGRKIEGVSFNVNTSVYSNKNIKRSGVCLLYQPDKSNRLHFLILETAETLAKNYPHQSIYLYGSNDDKDRLFGHPNIQNLRVLTTEGMAELYNKCEIGVVFSGTNPSRIAFEMVGCGLPCIELRNEFTQYDLVSDCFIKVEPTISGVMDVVSRLLSDRQMYDECKKACQKYALENFLECKEERAFCEFLEKKVLSSSNRPRCCVV